MVPSLRGYTIRIFQFRSSITYNSTQFSLFINRLLKYFILSVSFFFIHIFFTVLE